MKFDMSIFRIPVEKIQVLLNSDKNNGYLMWRPMYIYDNTVFRSILLRIGNVSNKCCRESQIHFSKLKTHVSHSWTLSQKLCCLWYKAETYGTARWATNNIIRRMRFACWLHTHTQNMQYLLLFHGKSGCTNAPWCYVYMYTLVLLILKISENSTFYFVLYASEVLQLNTFIQPQIRDGLLFHLRR